MPTLNSVILGQFEAALCTLKQAISGCPEDLWNADHLDGTFSQVVFHALIFTDIYLGRDEEAIKLQPFHVEHRAVFRDYEELEDRPPVYKYERDFILSYLDFCLAKGRATIPRETDDVLLGDSGFSYRKFSRLELHIYSIRHIQHHAAQLGLRNQIAGSSALKWVGSGWKEL